MKKQPYQKNVVVIIDGVSTAAYLAPAFRAYGYNCIHVFSGMSNSIQNATYNPGDYLDEFSFNGDADALLQYLSKYQVEVVMAGAESGVGLADQIGGMLKLNNTNDLSLSQSRRNKFEMYNQLKNGRINHAAYFTFRSLKGIKETIDSRKAYVVKPLKSAGTDCVRICFNRDQVLEASGHILGTRDIYNQINKAVLLQEYIEGTEYMVNAVSNKQRHKIIEIWKTYKINSEGAPIYDRVELLHPEDKIYNTLSAYVIKCLDAMGICFGPSHTEVIEKNDQFFFVESGARVQGGQDAFSVALATGSTHSISTVLSIVDPEIFYQDTNPVFHRHCMGVTLSNHQAGYCVDPPDFSEIWNLESVTGVRSILSKGAYYDKTRDLLSTVGGVFLSHKDKQVLESDLATIRKLEKENYYSIYPQPHFKNAESLV